MLGIWILPVDELRKLIDSGITYDEVERDLPTLQKLLGEKITVPLYIVGVNIKNGER